MAVPAVDTLSTIGDMLDRQAERFAERDALVNFETGERFTYSEFRDEVDRVARGLMALGIRKGQHVGIWSTNYSEWVLTQFATAKIGAVMVNVNPAYRTHELAYVLEQSEANALIFIGRFRNSDYAAMVNEVVPELKDCNPGELSSSQFPYLRHVIFIPPHSEPDAATPPGMWSWSDMVGRHAGVSGEQLAARQMECHFDDPVNIQYTSGTTGNPKGAMLTHHNLVANGVYVGDCIELTEQRSPVHSSALLPLLRLRDGQPGLHHPRVGHRHTRRALRPAQDPAGAGQGAVHSPLRRPDYVHFPARPPGIRQF